jgi:hypothetical protein
MFDHGAEIDQMLLVLGGKTLRRKFGVGDNDLLNSYCILRNAARGPFQHRSSTVAIPCPTPIHMVQSA